MNYATYKRFFDRLKRTNTRYTDLVKITRQDGAVIRLTAHDENITIPNDGEYLSAVSFEISALEQNHSFAITNADFSVLIDSDIITEQDLEVGLYDDATIELMLCYWDDVNLGTLPLKFGWFGDVTLEGPSFRSEFRGIADRLGQIFTKVLSLECRYPFGQEGCRFDLSTVTHTHTVTEAINRGTFRFSGTYPPDAYQWGLARFTSGANNGQEMEILHHFENKVGLFLPVRYNIQVGDTLEIVEGCSKTLTACIGFGQTINFGGEPFIQGSDAMQDYPDAKD